MFSRECCSKFLWLIFVLNPTMTLFKDEEIIICLRSIGMGEGDRAKWFLEMRQVRWEHGKTTHFRKAVFFWKFVIKCPTCWSLKMFKIWLKHMEPLHLHTPMKRETGIFQDNGFSHHFCRFRVSKHGVHHCNITTLGKQHVDLIHRNIGWCCWWLSRNRAMFKTQTVNWYGETSAQTETIAWPIVTGTMWILKNSTI